MNYTPVTIGMKHAKHLKRAVAVIRWLTPPAMNISPSGLCSYVKGGARKRAYPVI
ncbi:hypothetical protein [Fuerstiella marisgermanici]|uniref:Uncharacterized protein n=1 Tax=Fuerstiella marisgermanici TaxID=1891926 RepID=A0A1P8WQX9_9PLAN|nr:hypothetical protein [Fuerstiella marisgermanici]APZ96463.1 hypothetical protein Fuma_06132 [Fuerstiella marisgermanici]